MQKKLLSIAMPSNRDFQSSFEAVHSAVIYCKKTGTQLVVSDNSGDPVKERELSNLMQGEGLLYIKSPPCSMIENWNLAFDASDSEFVLVMGDDDRIFSFCPQPDFSKVASDVVAIKPCLFAYTDTAGIHKVNFSPIQAANAHERILENWKASNGCNMAIFSFWRRTLLKSIFDLLFIHHPTKGTYCDWAWMNGLVSSGKIVMDPSLSYFYNLQNWAGSSEAIQGQLDRAFVTSGLPAGSSAYGSLFNAIDSYIFINRQDSPLNENERKLSAIFCFNIYLQGYIKDMPATSKHENAEKIANLSKKLVGNDSVPDIFAIITEILDAVRPNLGKQYQEFHQKAVGKNWGVL